MFRPDQPKELGRQKTQATAPSNPDEPMNQATSSSAIVSSGGEKKKRPVDPTIEGEIPMSDVKRPRGRPITRILLIPGTVDREGCTSGKGDGYYHNVHSKRRAAERAATASRVGGAAPQVGGASQTTIQASSGAASSFQVGGAIQNVETRVGVQAMAGPSAVHVGVANETQPIAAHVGAANETQLRAVHMGTANQDTIANS